MNFFMNNQSLLEIHDLDDFEKITQNLANLIIDLE